VSDSPDNDAPDRRTLRVGWAVLLIGLAAGGTLLYMVRPRWTNPQPGPQAPMQPAQADSPAPRGAVVTASAGKASPAAGEASPTGSPPSAAPPSPRLMAAIEAPRMEEIARAFGAGAAPPTAPVENVVLDDYKQPYSVGPLSGSRRISLSGRVARLEIKGLTDQAQLDVSNLQTREIRISGDLGGHSALRLKAPYCTLTVTGNITGQARVDVDLYGGSVRFNYSNTITDNARATIAARSVRIGRIDDQADVSVVLSRGGILRVGYVHGSSRLRWRKAEADDPKPQIYTGKIAGQAKVEQE